jgi:beta-glucosidase
MPIKQLRKFKRISLNKDSEQSITFEFNAIKDLRYYNSIQKKYMVENGDFEIQIGSSSKDIRLTCVINVNEK